MTLKTFQTFQTLYIYIYIYIYIESKGTGYSTFYVSVCKATVPTPSR